MLLSIGEKILIQQMKSTAMLGYLACIFTSSEDKIGRQEIKRHLISGSLHTLYHNSGKIQDYFTSITLICDRLKSDCEVTTSEISATSSGVSVPAVADTATETTSSLMYVTQSVYPFAMTRLSI